MSLAWQLQQHIAQKIDAVWPNGVNRLLVGVSGGADSVCLLHLLQALSSVKCFSISVLHVHHSIRQGEADDDAAFVSHLCTQLGVPCIVETVDAPAYAKTHKKSLEDAARILRHAVFTKHFSALKAQAVVLAHHEDDQAETVLLHLLRGTSGAGICGMALFRDHLFRPLLEIPAKTLKTCLLENAWTWREDATNIDEKYRRNALRHSILPRLAEVTGQNVSKPIARFAAIAQEDQAYLQEQTSLAWEQIALPDDACANTIGQIRFSRPLFQNLPTAIARRVLLHAWQLASGAAQDLTYAHITSGIHATQGTGKQGQIDLPRGYSLVFDDDTCTLGHSSNLRVNENLATPIKMVSGKKIEIPGGFCELITVLIPELHGKMTVSRISQGEAAISQNSHESCAQDTYRQIVDGRLLGQSLTLRNRRSGDIFDAAGSPGKKTLKKWLIDQKIPANRRYNIPLLALGTEVLWVIGYRRSKQMATPDPQQGLYELVWCPEVLAQCDGVGMRV